MNGTTAFVLAGGGSLGAIQVGMLRALVAHGLKPDLVVGSSVGALNGAYFAGDGLLLDRAQSPTSITTLPKWLADSRYA